MVVARRLTGRRITAAAAGVLMGTVGASPFVESFTLSGELLASLPAVLSLLAFVLYLENRRSGWLVAAGLLTGCAVMVKQSALDAGLAAALFLVWRDRRRAAAPLGVLALSTLVPLAAGAASATDVGAWWRAVIAYRASGDSLVTGSPLARVHLLESSLPPAAKALGLLVLLAAVGWRRSPLLARLWLVAAVVGVVGGGNFHPHYYLQLVPPLSVLGAVGIVAIAERRSRLSLAAAAAASAATIAFTVPLWLASPAAQARTIWPHDPHLRHDAAVARYVHAHTRAREQILVVWAAADLYYLADRDPAIRYLWERPLQTIADAVPQARRALDEGRPALVVLAQRPSKLDRSGETARILRTRYRLAAVVDTVPVYRRRSSTRNPAAATGAKAAR
jgi:4-amino-4-deoxy-L-arabinose transferase-like glycosyltransferase